MNSVEHMKDVKIVNLWPEIKEGKSFIDLIESEKPIQSMPPELENSIFNPDLCYELDKLIVETINHITQGMHVQAKDHSPLLEPLSEKD